MTDPDAAPTTPSAGFLRPPPPRQPVEGSGRRPPIGWARRLARVFGIDVETCSQCGGRLRIIVCIKDRRLIDSIPAHLERRHATPSLSGFAVRRRAPSGPGSSPPLH